MTTTKQTLHDEHATQQRFNGGTVLRGALHEVGGQAQHADSARHRRPLGCPSVEREERPRGSLFRQRRSRLYQAAAAWHEQSMERAIQRRRDRGLQTFRDDDGIHQAQQRVRLETQSNGDLASLLSVCHADVRCLQSSASRLCRGHVLPRRTRGLLRLRELGPRLREPRGQAVSCRVGIHGDGDGALPAPLCRLPPSMRPQQR